MDPRTERMLAEREQKAAVPPLLKRPSRAINEARAWVKAHGLAAKLGAAAAFVVLIAAYYLLVTMPGHRLERLEMEARAAERVRSQTAANQVAMDDCLSKAAAEAEARWSAACTSRRERSGCSLPAPLTDELQRAESQARNSCLMQSSLGAR